MNKEQRIMSWLQDAVIAEKPSALVSSSDYLDKPVSVGPKYIGVAPPPEPPKSIPFPAVLRPALQAEQAENGPQTPFDLSKLKLHVTTPEQKAALQKLLSELNTKPIYKKYKY